MKIISLFQLDLMTIKLQMMGVGDTTLPEIQIMAGDINLQCVAPLINDFVQLMGTRECHSAQYWLFCGENDFDLVNKCKILK